MLSGIAIGGVAGILGRFRKDRLVKGFSAYGLAELCIRVTRIVTAIVLARWLDAVDLGIAATAIATYELFGFLASRGIGQLVIRAADDQLEATLVTAHRLSFALAAVVGAAIVAAGGIIAWTTGRHELFAMIACLAATLVFLPFGLVPAWLMEREFRATTLSRIHVLQVGSDNILTAMFAVLGFGAWSIVLPRLISTPIWLIATRRARSWKRAPATTGIPVGQVIRFCAPILASELLVAVRFNLDKLLVGWLLGMQALGVYYFAFSAGYGLSLVLTSALASSSYAYLAEARLSVAEMVQRFDQALRRLALPISGLILLQAFAVFFYVPLLFGEKWAPETPIVAILCLSATTKSWLDLSSQLLRAAGLSGREFAASCIYTVVFVVFIAIGFQRGLLEGAAILSITTIVMQLLFAAWARRCVLRNAVATRPAREAPSSA